MVGNLLPDMHRGRVPEGINDKVMLGVLRHRRVDAFTDHHPVFARSRSRLPASHRRYAGIIVDVFYDHILSLHWHAYAREPRADFITRCYGTLAEGRELMPPMMQAIIPAMTAQDWLSTYDTADGIELTLRRISARLYERFGRTVPLAESTESLRRDIEGYTRDFLEFFPELCRYVGVVPRIDRPLANHLPGVDCEN